MGGIYRAKWVCDYGEFELGPDVPVYRMFRKDGWFDRRRNRAARDELRAYLKAQEERCRQHWESGSSEPFAAQTFEQSRVGTLTRRPSPQRL